MPAQSPVCSETVSTHKRTDLAALIKACRCLAQLTLSEQTMLNKHVWVGCFLAQLEFCSKGFYDSLKVIHMLSTIEILSNYGCLLM